jgi:hypothetical protein
MDISLIATGAMTLLKPLLQKAGEKAAETIGEKLAQKTVEKSFWQQAKGLFIIEEEKQVIKAIENKTLATQHEVTLIENKLTKEIANNPQFAAEVQASFNLSSTNIFVAEQLLKSIQADRLKLVELLEDKRLASIETEGSYEIMIKRTRKRLEKDEKEFITLITVQ